MITILIFDSFQNFSNFETLGIFGKNSLVKIFIFMNISATAQENDFEEQSELTAGLPSEVSCSFNLNILPNAKSPKKSNKNKLKSQREGKPTQNQHDEGKLNTFSLTEDLITSKSYLVGGKLT